MTSQVLTPEKLVSILKTHIIEANCVIYRDLFVNTPVLDATDLYWRKALEFFSSLNRDEREILFSIIRQVSVDTVSNVLGVIDGSNYIDEMNVEWCLCSIEDRVPLNGDLQSLFLATEEN